MADGSNSNSAGEELLQIIEQVESLDEEKAAITKQQRDILADAKGRGYETKAIRKLIAERKRDANDLAEEIAVLDMYREAIGMARASTSTAEDETADMV